MTYKTENDSIIFSTYSTAKRTTMIPVGKAKTVADMNEAFQLLGTGDSAIFKLPSDSLFTKPGSRPAFIKQGAYIIVGIKVDTVVTSDGYTALMTASAGKQIQTEEELIKKYLDENKIIASPTESGLYYVVETPGKGDNAKAGDSVSVIYTGLLLNGKIFDATSMSEAKKPFTFQLGAHNVVQGWDEGLTYFNKGAKGKLFIPSHLGYKERAIPNRIPANSVLVFEVELANIK